MEMVEELYVTKPVRGGYRWLPKEREEVYFGLVVGAGMTRRGNRYVTVKADHPVKQAEGQERFRLYQERAISYESMGTQDCAERNYAETVVIESGDRVAFTIAPDRYEENVWIAKEGGHESSYLAAIGRRRAYLNAPQRYRLAEMDDIRPGAEFYRAYVSLHSGSEMATFGSDIIRVDNQPFNPKMTHVYYHIIRPEWAGQCFVEIEDFLSKRADNCSPREEIWTMIVKMKPQEVAAPGWVCECGLWVPGYEKPECRDHWRNAG